jgi:hypothetical protein
LNEAIDRIAGAGTTQETADLVASKLNGQELRQAAIIHLSALLEASPTAIAGEQVIIGGLSVRLINTDDPKAPIRYDDIGVGFAVEGASLVRRDGPTSLSALLSLCCYARERSDSLLYLPHEMRNRRITDLAEESGASERFVRYVLVHYDTLSARAKT